MLTYDKRRRASNALEIPFFVCSGRRYQPLLTILVLISQDCHEFCDPLRSTDGAKECQAPGRGHYDHRRSLANKK